MRAGGITMRRLLLASLFALLAVSTGCGNVESGGVTTKDGAPTPGADDDDDDGAGDDDDDGGTFEPGPVPEMLGGMATFARTRDRSVGDLAGVYEDFIGMVTFFPVPVPVPPTLKAVWEDFPDMPMDTCERVYPSSVGLSTNITPPNAGEITMTGPNGSITLTMLMGIGMYMSVWNDPAKYVPLSDYTLSAPGGAGIGAFEIPYHSPGLITAMTPDITAVTPFVINRAVPLPITWDSIPDGRPIYLFLNQQDSPESMEWVWMCKMADDGAFEIPTAMLGDFGPTYPPFGGEQWRDNLALRRWHYTTFEVPGAVAPIISAFESGWYADVQLQ
jgi:hypothetical protein